MSQRILSAAHQNLEFDLHREIVDVLLYSFRELLRCLLALLRETSRLMQIALPDCGEFFAQIREDLVSVLDLIQPRVQLLAVRDDVVDGLSVLALKKMD